MSEARREYRSPLGRARGLGAAKEGVGHWWAQRVTAVALVPLVLWFAISLAGLVGASHEEVRAWLSRPFPAIASVLFLIATFYHAALGCQVILEDYVSGKAARIAAILAVNLAAFALAVAGIFAILKIAFGGPAA